ncbi:MAG: methyl-accepting chemotaxis protein [Spirochaetaceae bacterium]|nr:MAG: methyl-accepting chemotaxis protein [Spirochaetaceae bacterium]
MAKPMRKRCSMPSWSSRNGSRRRGASRLYAKSRHKHIRVLENIAKMEYSVRMKIRAKLLAIIFVTLFIFLSITVFLFSSLSTIQGLERGGRDAALTLAAWNDLAGKTGQLLSSNFLSIYYPEQWEPSYNRFISAHTNLVQNEALLGTPSTAALIENLTNLWNFVHPSVRSIPEFFTDSSNQPFIDRTENRSVLEMQAVLRHEPEITEYRFQIAILTSLTLGVISSSGTFERILTELPDSLETEVNDIQQALVTQSVVILSLGILFILFLLLSFTRKLTTRLKLVETGMNALSNQDLTQNIVVRSKDEMGVLANHANQVIVQLKDIIRNIQTTTREAHELQDDLSSSTEETSATVHEITSNIQSIERQFAKLDELVKEVLQVVDSITLKLKEQAQGADKQSASINQTSSAMEQMSASIASVSTMAREREKAVTSLEKVTQQGSETVELTFSIIQHVTSEINNLMEIIDIINAIASQTNLLSMNAAIESAHAGEAGRGFAVVAEEIRKLADSSAENASIIAKSLTAMTDQIGQAEKTSRKNRESFEDIHQEVENTSRAFREITHAMQEMSQGTAEVIQGAQDIREVSDQSIHQVKAIEADSLIIQDHMGNLQQLSSQVLAGIQEISVGSNEIQNAMVSLNLAGEKTKKSILTMDEQVSVFKTASDATEDTDASLQPL